MAKKPKKLTKKEQEDIKYLKLTGLEEDDYDFKPVPKRKSKYWDWEPGKWSNYHFGRFFDEDNNSHLIVRDPVTYITPTTSEIKSKAGIWLNTSIDLIKELARVCYFKMIEDKEYLVERFKDLETLSAADKKMYNTKKPLFDAIFENFIPGWTPLEQALAIFHKIQTRCDNSNPYRDEDKFNMDEGLQFQREVYWDPDINDQLDFNPLSKTKKMDILNKISIIGDLGSQFKVEKEIKEKIVANSDQFSKKIMTEYDQIMNIEHYQRLFPNFKRKFYTKDLIVNVPVDRIEKKQKIIILLDFSGSMRNVEKQIWVNALLIERFKYVIRGEAEVFFSYFVHGTHTLNFLHIKNREDVVSFWQQFSNNPSGGTTDIGGNVTYIHKQIKAKKLHNLDVDLSEENPEILIINDGQDRVGYDSLPYKVNALSLIDFSDELKKLCIKTGGKQVRISSNNAIMCYSSEGEEMLAAGKTV